MIIKRKWFILHRVTRNLLNIFKDRVCDIFTKNFVRNLGVYFESTGYSSKHINQICKTSYFSLYKISKVRSLLDQASTEKLVHAFITSPLDYCNSVLYGSPDYEINSNPFKTQQHD